MINARVSIRNAPLGNEGRQPEGGVHNGTQEESGVSVADKALATGLGWGWRPLQMEVPVAGDHRQDQDLSHETVSWAHAQRQL